MKDYYNLFVGLSLQQCTKNDYNDKRKVKMHNIASKRLIELFAEMKQSNCEEILGLLLSHDDDRVKINAASFCLQMMVHANEAVLVLKNIINYSNDLTLRFSAKMILTNQNASIRESSPD